MLGFVLSKMQMLLFATAMFVVALLFYNFIAGMETATAASNTLMLSEKAIKEQVKVDSLCSMKIQQIPENFNYGISGGQLYYDMVFSKQPVGDANALILSIAEKGKPNYIASQSILEKANFVLIDPGFMAAGESIKSYYNKDTIKLSPRSMIGGQQLAAANSFVIVKEVSGGVTNLYIIPCATAIKYSCQTNVARVGCLRLSQIKASPVDSDMIPSCFAYSVLTDTGSTKLNIDWKDCKDNYPVS